MEAEAKLLCGCSEVKPCEDHAPRPHEAPAFLVLWPNGLLGGFQRADVCACALAENKRDGSPAEKIWQLSDVRLQVLYNPITAEEVREIAFPTPLATEVAA